MSRISAIMNNILIRRKLIVSYVFVVFLPVMTVGLLLNQITSGPVCSTRG